VLFQHQRLRFGNSTPRVSQNIPILARCRGIIALLIPSLGGGTYNAIFFAAQRRGSAQIDASERESDQEVDRVGARQPWQGCAVPGVAEPRNDVDEGQVDLDAGTYDEAGARF